MRAYDRALPLLTLSGGEAARAATAAGLSVVVEAFADRAYQSDGTLVPRGQPGAVLTDPGVVAARAVAMATSYVVTSVTGAEIAVRPRSFNCCGARQQVEGLKDEADLCISDTRQLAVAVASHIFSVQSVTARGGQVYAAKNIEQCGFTGPGRAAHDDKFASSNTKRNRLQSLYDAVFTARVRFRNAFEFDH